MNDNMTTATHMFDHSKKLAEAYEKVMLPHNHYNYRPRKNILSNHRTP